VIPAVVWKTAHPTPGIVLPDGCMDLIWFGGRLIVAGPDTRPQLIEPSLGAPAIGVRFAPGVGPHVLGVPAAELRDARVPLDSLWSTATVRRITERMAESPFLAADLEMLAAVRLRAEDRFPRDLKDLVAMIRSGTRVSEVARRLGVSERQLHRRSLAEFGYGPKVLSRILRFVQASELLRAGLGKAETAARAGYADQPHMTREFRALTGSPLGALVPSGE
jgi:AraC-like DNA-binding protein